MSESPPFVSRRVRFSGLIDAGLLIGLGATWLGLAGRWHWLLDLCTHFRWQSIMVCVLALLWAGFRRRLVTGVAGLLTLGLNAWLIFHVPGPAPSATVREDFRVKVISFNVLTSNSNKTGVLEWLQQEQADVILLMETDRAWVKAMQPLKQIYPHFFEGPSADNFGIALYSRIPFAAPARELDRKALGLPEDDGSDIITDSVEARLLHQGREWVFIGTHPVPPMGRAYAAGRDRQLEAIGRYVSGLKVPALVAGDLNASPWCHGFRVLTENTPLRATRDAWKPTWKVGHLLGVPIDHALTSPPLQLSSRLIGPDLGSDHRAQVMELRWAE